MGASLRVFQSKRLTEGDRVWLQAKHKYGVIIFDDRECFKPYKVRWVYNGDVKETWFFEDEVQAAEDGDGAEWPEEASVLIPGASPPVRRGSSRMDDNRSDTSKSSGVATDALPPGDPATPPAPTRPQAPTKPLAPSSLTPALRQCQWSRGSAVQQSGRLFSSNRRANTSISKKGANLVDGILNWSADGTLCCDRCDGRHRTEDCPIFEQERDDHKDAWVNYGRRGNPHQMGESGGSFYLKGAQIVRQPGDGSCLFHSLAFGLQDDVGAGALRRDIAYFLQRHADLEIAGDTLEEWVSWESQMSVGSYAQRMASGSCWGGGIEMACFARLKRANVHVYEPYSRWAVKRIACFNAPAATKTVHILYRGGVHYDALLPDGSKAGTSAWNHLVM